MTECNSLIIYKNQLAVITEVSEKISIKYQSSPKTSTGKSAIYSTQKIREKDMTLLYPANLIKEKKQLQNLNKPESIIEYLLEIAEDKNYQGDINSKIQETHELLISDDETQNSSFSFFELAELCLGEFLAKDSWIFYQQLKATHYFKEESENFVPRSLSEIEKILDKENAKENQSKLYEEFINRLKQKSVNQDDFQYMQEIEAFCLGKTDKSKILYHILISPFPFSSP